jgi:hypothetical protein
MAHFQTRADGLSVIGNCERAENQTSKACSPLPRHVPIAYVYRGACTRPVGSHRR